MKHAATDSSEGALGLRRCDVAAGTLTRAGKPGDEFPPIVDARAEVSAQKHVLLHPSEFFEGMCLLDGAAVCDGRRGHLGAASP